MKLISNRIFDASRENEAGILGEKKPNKKRMGGEGVVFAERHATLGDAEFTPSELQVSIWKPLLKLFFF